MMIMTAILGIGFIFALAGDFILWAKADEYKRTAQDEHANYLAALGLHNAAAEHACALDEKNQKLKDAFKAEMERTSRLDKDCARLEQSLRSALRCPNNDHVWKDGVCVKCGRVK